MRSGEIGKTLDIATLGKDVSGISRTNIDWLFHPKNTTNVIKLIVFRGPTLKRIGCHEKPYAQNVL